MGRSGKEGEGRTAAKRKDGGRKFSEKRRDGLKIEERLTSSKRDSGFLSSGESQPLLCSKKPEKEEMISTESSRRVELEVEDEEARETKRTSNLGSVSSIEQLEIPLESTLVNDLVVPLLVVRRSEEDVLSKSLVLKPRLLIGVGDSTGSRERE